MDRLERIVVPDAFHNSSSTGYDPPRCAPDTRVTVLQEIMSWLDDTDDGNVRTMWIRGAAGSGKTAIARSVAVLCSEQERLSGSFFFSRSRSRQVQGQDQEQGQGQGQGRKDEDNIVATLAYQLLIHIPTAEPFILSASNRNRFLFTLSLSHQLEQLILTPLSHQSQTMCEPEKAALFIIDALDETTTKDGAVNIIREFTNAMQRLNHNLPHKLLILSRPEQHIAGAMSEIRDLGLVSINLDERPEVHDEVRSYLHASFARIGRGHPLRGVIPVLGTKGWPTRKDVSVLVHRASGQFGYAAAVVKYVGDDRGDPVERLRDIIELKRGLRGRPYKHLDDMFLQILDSIPSENKQLVVLIFRIVLMQYIPPKVDAHTGFNSKISFICGLLGMSRVEVLLVLKDLPAVVIVTTPAEDVYFLQASIVDFLLDRERAGRFYVNEESVCLDLVQRCLDGILELNRTNFKDELTFTNPTVQTINRYLAGVRHFQESITKSRPALFKILCQWDLTEALYLVSTSKARAYTEFQFSLLLEWIVIEYFNWDASSTSKRNPLHDVIMDLKSWWISQARKFEFRDDWIIFDPYHRKSLQHIHTTLHHPEVILWLYLTTDIKKDSVLHRFFCNVEEWEEGMDLMDGRRYAVLAGYCCRYLFASGDTHTEAASLGANGQNHFEDIMLRARRALHYSEFCLELASFFEVTLNLNTEQYNHKDKEPANLESRVQMFLQTRYTDIRYLHWIRTLARAVGDYVGKAKLQAC